MNKIIILTVIAFSLTLTACVNELQQVKAWVKIDGFNHTVSTRDAILTCNPGKIYSGASGFIAMAPCMEKYGYKQGWVAQGRAKAVQ